MRQTRSSLTLTLHLTHCPLMLRKTAALLMAIVQMQVACLMMMILEITKLFLHVSRTEAAARATSCLISSTCSLRFVL